LAHHYTSALELGRAAGESTEAIEARARDALEHAGDRALALNAYATAAGFYEQALELWPPHSLEHARLLFRAGRARYVAHQGGEDSLERAAGLLAEIGDVETAAEAELALWELQLRRGQREVADPHLEAALALVAGAPSSRAKRSEERRVGKEWRAWRGGFHCEKRKAAERNVSVETARRML